MTTALPLVPPDELVADARREPEGAGRLGDGAGDLPLVAMEVDARICELVHTTTVRQVFRNTRSVALEAVYVFPLPDRAAVTSFVAELGGRRVEGVLKERGAARDEYEDALAVGRRAALAEEDRPGVFTTSVGNIQPGEEAEVTLVLTGELGVDGGEATYRFPLVVAPRYVPGTPLPGPPAGDGWAVDTDAVPDASRVTPPVLVPGSPSPVRLALRAEVDPGGLGLAGLRSSLHAVAEAPGADGSVVVALHPGERLDRDVILRIAYGGDRADVSALAAPDEPGRHDGPVTLRVTVAPPPADQPPPARDVVLLLDRSGSMQGWKMVAARRAAARLVDSLGPADRFAVVAFDHEVDRCPDLPPGLVAGTDRNRFAAVRWLGALEARGGTEILAAAVDGAAALAAGDTGRDRFLVLVTDGQVANEDQVVGEVAGRLAGTRVFALGIDRAVNAGFLQRLAMLGAGRCELVESEERLDEVLAGLHRRIAPPVLRDVRVEPVGAAVVAGTAPEAADCFAAGPLVVALRCESRPAAVRVVATTSAGEPWHREVEPAVAENPAVRAVWARAHVRDLEDRYAAGRGTTPEEIVAASLAHGVLSRFTAFVAVDRSPTGQEGRPLTVVQPVELPAGWAAGAPPGAPQPMRLAAAAPVSRPGRSAPREQKAITDPGRMAARLLRARPQTTGRTAASGPPASPEGGGWAQEAAAAFAVRIEALVLRAMAGGDAALRADLVEAADDLASVGGPAELVAALRRLADALGTASVADAAGAVSSLLRPGAEPPRRRRRRFWA